MRKIKVGIIGQGRSGRDIHRHLFECMPALQERFDVVAVADPIPERRANSNPGANPDCKHYADYRELLQDKNIELVVNASRSHKHPVALLYYSAVVNLLTLEESAAVIESADPSILKSPFADSYISSIKKR